MKSNTSTMSSGDRNLSCVGCGLHIVPCNVVLKPFLNLPQAQSSHDALQERIAALQATIDEAEDGVFEDFCNEIGVENIREFEERQLKVAQEESAARLQFDTQIARLTHQ